MVADGTVIVGMAAVRGSGRGEERLGITAASKRTDENEGEWLLRLYVTREEARRRFCKPQSDSLSARTFSFGDHLTAWIQSGVRPPPHPTPHTHISDEK